jgi:hypothetical protein
MLAERLRDSQGLETIFIVGASSESKANQNFPIYSPLRAVVGRMQLSLDAAIILHYVNYGYDRRGIPLWLPRMLRRIKGSRKLLTIFHELYAGGSPSQSAFWLRPLQIKTARSLAEISDVGFVSSKPFYLQLHNLRPTLPIVVQSIPSNFGEPELSATAIENRDPCRWVICGGNELIERSLRSFVKVVDQIDSAYAPRELFVIGGVDNSAVRQILAKITHLRTSYHPDIEKHSASAILSGCSFGWIDYFNRPDAPYSLLLKSSAFAALCAHGVIPVVPNMEQVAGEGDQLPGPFHITAEGQILPPGSTRRDVARSIYDWYGHKSSSVHLAESVGRALTRLR